MQLNLTVEERALVASVEAFAARLRGSSDSRQACLHSLCARGWSAPGWPKPWGGGLAMKSAFLVEQTLVRAGVPVLDARTLLQAGPLLIALADESLCRRFLPGMASGEIRWALHGSISGAAPVQGRFLSAEPGFEPTQTLIAGAGRATAIALVLADGRERALAVAELTDGAVVANLPLDPETILLESLAFEVLASTRTHPRLAQVLAGLDRGAAGVCCWTGRLRRQYDDLIRSTDQQDGAADPDEELAALGIAISGLEITEQRAVAALDDSLRDAVAIRSVELGRALAEIAVARLGYYALSAADPTVQHNELPGPALAARDAMAELIRYLDDDFGARRDRLARNLGLAGD